MLYILSPQVVAKWRRCFTGRLGWCQYRLLYQIGCKLGHVTLSQCRKETPLALQQRVKLHVYYYCKQQLSEDTDKLSPQEAGQRHENRRYGATLIAGRLADSSLHVEMLTLPVIIVVRVDVSCTF